VAPKTREERRKLYARCGAKAFLLPDPIDPGKSKFPIMPKHGPCVIDCRALRVALTRAGQYGYRNVQTKARRLARRARCRWEI
jgi:hypothetical protein